MSNHSSEGPRLSDTELAEVLASPRTWTLWFSPDGSRILELSTKCAPTEGFQVAAEMRAFLTGNGVNLSGEQQTKTREGLEYFAGSLGTAAEA
jgi:hypothetical protein